ncbi:MAG: hypothetical protein EXX96DRAFT_456859, partial [Benjaminiella poitrasii]
VDSFVDENNSYVIFVDNNSTIQTCTCFYYHRNQRPCKHMYLLSLQVSKFELVCTNQTSSALPLFMESTPSLESDSNRTISPESSVRTTLRHIVDIEN